MSQDSTFSLLSFARILSGDENDGSEAGSTSSTPQTSEVRKLSSESLVVLFLFGGLMIAGFVREINKKKSIPYTPMLFVIGMFVGKFSENTGLLGETISKIATINPHGILMIFLPILIFESGFNSDWHTFKKQSGQIFLLAFPCVLFSAIFLLISLKVILQYDDSYYTWSGAFMFGSILSCTDTIAVLSLLKEVGAPKKLNSLIEGESLLNDGTCMVLFQISSEFAKVVVESKNEVDSAAALAGGAHHGSSAIDAQEMQFDLIKIIKLLLSLTVGGVILGILFGMVAQFWIRRIHNDPILTVNVTFITCYLTYFVAENVDLGIKVSGIMALVSLGIYLSIFGKTKISSEEKRTVNIFWKYVVYAAESTIFILAGILVGVKVLTSSGEPYMSIDGIEESNDQIKTSDYFKLLGLYVCMILSRFGSIACFMPQLKKWGYGLTWKEVYVLAYGGLRGAIGISFAMIVANDEDYPQKFRNIVLFDMAGNAILTLIINGTTTGPLVRSLGLSVTSTVRERVFLNILQDLKEDTEKKINYYKNNNYLKMVNWESVKELVGSNDLETKIKRLDDDLNKREEIELYTQKIRNKNVIDTKIDELKHTNEFHKENQSFDSDSTNHNLDENMIVECRNRFLMALKGNYWELFDRNQCSSNALLLLIDSVNWDLDTEQERMNSWEFLSNYFYNPYYIKVLFMLKGWPIVGSYAGNLLFNHISNIYDVISSYIEVHELAEQLCAEQFPFIPQVIEIIIRESQDNRMSGEEYIKNDLNVSFPEITKQIQTKKATYSLLECQRKIIKKGQMLGQIDEKERDVLMNQIDEKIVSLDNIQPSWKAPPIKNFLENVPFFQLIHKDLLPFLIKESFEMIFEKDMYIIKEGEKAKYFFVITRGSATETTSQSFCTYHEKKEVGSLISPHHLIIPSLRYLTSCMADAVVYVLAFPLSSIQKVIKVNFQIKEYIWLQSLRALSQLYYNELKPLGSLDRNSFLKFLPKLHFAKYNKGKTIQCESGGILLKGQVTRKELTDILTSGKGNTGESSQLEQAEGRSFKSFYVLMPGMAFSLFTEKKCTFLHFAEDCEEVRFMMGHFDYSARLSQQVGNNQAHGNVFSPVSLQSNAMHKKNSFAAPHLSRLGRKSIAIGSLDVNIHHPPHDLTLSKFRSQTMLDEQPIKPIKSDDEDSDEGISKSKRY